MPYFLERFLEKEWGQKENKVYSELEIEKIIQGYKDRHLNLKKGDVYWAAIGFEDDADKYKIRPVIIWDASDLKNILILKCSSVENPGKYKIQNYFNLGLDMIPYVEYRKVGTLESKYLLGCLRKPLSSADLKNLSKLLID